MLTKRSALFLALGSLFLGTLVLLARGSGDICPEGSYCHLRYKIPYAKPDSSRPTSSPSSSSSPYDTEVPIPSESPVGGSIGTTVPSSSNGGADRKFSDHGASYHGDLYCENFPDTSDVLVVMKTGASEAYSKIPTQLMTNLRCIDDFLLFSDMEQDIAGYRIHDSLDTVLDSVKVGNQDFDLYFYQQECPIDQDNCNKHYDVAPKGWALDKYKNIHMAEKAYAMRPNYKWYIFVDADTYVVFSTLMAWLKNLSPAKQYYLGSVAMLGPLAFAHGGSGYLVSQSSMKKLFGGSSDVANRWDADAARICCGDALFAQAIKDEAGVQVSNAWPTINGEKPNSLEYSEEQWCQPIVTMHHINSEEVSDFDAFEQSRNFSEPMLIKDIYHRFVEGHLTDIRENWDNGSKDDVYLNITSPKYANVNPDDVKWENLNELEAKAHLSAEDCRAACYDKDDCMQYLFHDEMCALHHKIKQGAPVEVKDNAESRYISGWNMDRIEAWVKDRSNCLTVSWPNV